MMRKRGFTLLEVIIASGIMVLLLSILYGFFIQNYRIAYTTNTRLTLAQQGHQAIEEIQGLLMGCAGMELLDGEEITPQERSIEAFTFFEASTSTEEQTLYKFKVEEQRLSYAMGTSKEKSFDLSRVEWKKENQFLAQRIESIQGIPLFIAENPTKARGIKLIFTLVEEEEKRILESIIYFRNNDLIRD